LDSNRQRKIGNNKRNIQKSFYDSPSYYLVDAYIASTPLSATPLDVWITDDSDNKDQKKIIVYPDQTLEKGYIIYWTDKDNYWLVTQCDHNLGDVYSRGTMLECNATLRFVTGETKVQTGNDSLGRPIYTISPTYSSFKSIAKSSNRLTNLTDMAVNIPIGMVIFSIQNTANLTIDVSTEFEVYSQTWKVSSLDLTNTFNNVGGVLSFTAERRDKAP
jgi:hypothetical protein